MDDRKPKVIVMMTPGVSSEFVRQMLDRDAVDVEVREAGPMPETPDWPDHFELFDHIDAPPYEMPREERRPPKPHTHPRSWRP